MSPLRVCLLRLNRAVDRVLVQTNHAFVAAQTARPGVLDGVSSRSGRAAFARPVGVEELAARFVNTFVSVRAEVIALGLKQIRRQTFAAKTVVEGQSGAEGRNRDAFFDGGGHRVAPAALALLDCLLEKVVEHQVAQLRVLVERPFDFAEESVAVDATGAPT